MSDVPPKSDPTGRELVGFFIVTLLASWLLFSLAVVGIKAAPADSPPISALLLQWLGCFVPSLTAIALTARRQGSSAVRELLRRLIQWRVDRLSLAAALLLPSLFVILALPAFFVDGNRFEAGSWGRLALLPVGLLAAIPFGPLGEELGWRGYALPRLLRVRSPLAASLILGAIWTVWHLPLFWAPAGTSISGQPITVFSVGAYLALLCGYSVIYTWLHQRTGGSVFVAVLLHASFNAELFRFFVGPLADGASWTIERFALVPLWLFVAWLAMSGRLAPRAA